MVSWVLTGGPALHVRGETMSVISRTVVALTTEVLLTGAGTPVYAECRLGRSVRTAGDRAGRPPRRANVLALTSPHR
jgi:hypothetical protein